MQTQYTFSDDLVSDFHKDAYGFRPNQAFWSWWQSATDAEKQAEWDTLGEAMERREAMQQEDERVAIVAFEKRVGTIMLCGAGTRERAIEWLQQSEGIMAIGDEAFFEYLMGIPYGYIRKTAKTSE
jgi:hypothetical protein